MESRNYGITKGHGKSSIAPLFQSGAIIKQKNKCLEQSLSCMSCIYCLAYEEQQNCFKVSKVNPCPAEPGYTLPLQTV